MEFRIRSWSEREDPLVVEGLGRRLGIGGEQIVGGLDWPGVPLAEFLSTMIGAAEGIGHTVKGVIRYYSHVEGGVHFGKLKESGEPAMRSMSPRLWGHSTGQTRAFAHLGQMVVDALEPMLRSFLDQPTIQRQWHLKDGRGRYLERETSGQS